MVTGLTPRGPAPEPALDEGWIKLLHSRILGKSSWRPLWGGSRRGRARLGSSSWAACPACLQLARCPRQAGEHLRPEVVALQGA